MSDTEFTVDVSISCDRTGRISKVPMSVAKAATWAEEEATRKEMADQVRSFLKGLPPEAPDLAILYKGTAVVLTRVVTKEGDTTIARLLHDLTHAPEFPEAPPSTTRKKRAKNGTSISSPPVDSK